MSAVKLKAYRITGGAIVTIIRADKTRRYKVSKKRFARLRTVCAVWREAHGWHGHSLLDLTLETTSGYWRAVHWQLRHGSAASRKIMRA